MSPQQRRVDAFPSDLVYEWRLITRSVMATYMLAALVVHLKANYGNLTSGLATARNQTVVAVDGIKSSVKGLAGDLPRDIAATEHILTQTATAFSEVSQATAQLAADVTHLQTRATATATSLQIVANSGVASAQTFGLLSAGSRTTAAGLSTVGTWLSAIATLANLCAAAFTLLFIPLRMVGAIGSAGMSVLGAALWTVLLPVRILATAAFFLAKGIWAVVSPFLSLAFAALKVWVLFRGMIATWKLIGHWISMLPPKVRLLVGALIALGLAGKAGAVAMRVLGGAARIAGVAVRVLLLPIQLIRSPGRAAANALSLLAGAMLVVGRVGLRAGSGVVSLAASLGRMAAGGISSAIGSLNRLAGSIITTTVKAAALALIGGVMWGGSLAAQAEQAEVAFGTLLRSDVVAKKVLNDLQEFSAATPFALNDLREGAQNLLAFGVSSGDVLDKIKMLGDVAAGTGKPIGEFAQIYGKVKATGKASLETLNQLAERGVPIYSALADTLGVTRGEMLNMISAGQVGFPQLDAAIRSTVDSGGMFENAMVKQSTTVTGLWSTLKDNVGFAFQELATILMTAIDFKGLMTKGITFAQKAKGWFTSLTPVIMSVAFVVKAAFGAVWAIVSAVFGAVSAFSGATFGDIASLVVTAMAMAEFAFLNWQQVAQLAALKVALGVVQLGAEISHFFTDVLPALFTWFGNNWQNLFTTAASFVGNVFKNIASNIRAVMTAVWDFIASGGTAAFQVAWTPLTEGFINTVESLPDVPARIVGPLESSLQDQVDTLGKTLSTGMDALVAERLAALDKFTTDAQAAVPDITIQPMDVPIEDPAAETSDAAGGDKKFGALAKGSQEAASAIFAAMREKDNVGAKLQQKQLAVQQQQLAAANALNAKLGNAPQLAVIQDL